MWHFDEYGIVYNMFKKKLATPEYVGLQSILRFYELIC
jgi:hypothetical protein